MELPDFEIQHLYRGLEVIASESDFIQVVLYKNSLSLAKRNDRIIYYDCTNYSLEIEQAKGLKQYGPSKEHRLNPIVEMGLFMDSDGIPLAFSLHPSNTNEQITLCPLEERLINDFKLLTFVVCTDAGFSSTTNWKFNNKENRAFITTQAITKLKQWALSESGWFLAGDKKNQTYDPSEIAKINHCRWEIKECFRIMKTDFKARPVYLKQDDRIKAHFTTYFLALTLYRYLEKN